MPNCTQALQRGYEENEKHQQALIDVCHFQRREFALKHREPNTEFEIEFRTAARGYKLADFHWSIGWSGGPDTRVRSYFLWDYAVDKQ